VLYRLTDRQVQSNIYILRRGGDILNYYHLLQESLKEHSEFIEGETISAPGKVQKVRTRTVDTDKPVAIPFSVCTVEGYSRIRLVWI
jgi:hypothetical protein